MSIRNFSLFPAKDEPYTDKQGSKYCIPVVDPHFIDLNRLQRWIQDCDATHPHSCRQSLRPRAGLLTLGILLIDVFKMCLVQAEGTENYLALSYVWGPPSDLFATSKANLSDLRAPGSLESSDIHERLPGTVRRAIEFATLINERYLWVDRLCIVQDDPVHTASQVNGMATIYSNAYLTLCAADGVDSDTGLLGIPNTSHPRKVTQMVFDLIGDFGSSTFVVPHQKYQCSYEERGWAFQEKYLSRRIVQFTPRGLICVCDHGGFEEDRAVTGGGRSYAPYAFNHSDTLWPNMKRWYKMLDVYLERKLTYAQDILSAFSGVEEALKSSIGMFHYGLPEAFFDLALLWIPKAHLIRRTQYSKDSSCDNFPSWSWAGWQGPRTPDIAYLGLGHVRTSVLYPEDSAYSRYTKDIIPRVPWFKTSSEGRQRQQIRNDYAKYQENHETLETLPSGWSRNWKHGKAYYTYDLAPSDCSFWYPVPAIRNNEPLPDGQWGPILYFESLRAWLTIGDRFTEEEQRSTQMNCPVHSLFTFDQKWAGVIYVHENLVNDSELSHIPCELVVISSGFALEDEQGALWTKSDGIEFASSPNTVSDADTSTESAEEANSASALNWSTRSGGDMESESMEETSDESGEESVESSEGSVGSADGASNRRCFPEWLRLKREGRSARYEFYNVLWIQWHH